MATVTKDLGPVTAYKYAVSKGYTGTEEEFAQLMADLVLMSARVDEVEDDVEQVEGKVDTFDGRITTAEADISNVKPRVTTLEGKTATLEAGATWQDVKNSITLTKNTNCSNVTLSVAYKIGKLLFMMIYVTPVSGIAAGANVDVTYSGFTPKINNDFRFLSGIVGVGVYQAWLVSPNIIRFRFMSGSTAWTSANVAFTAIVPIA